MGIIGKIKAFSIISLCLCLAACSKSKEPNENPDKSGSKVYTNVSNELDEGTISDNKVIELKNGLKDASLTAIGQDAVGPGNLGINIKDQNLVLFCKDPVYNITYYINFGGDYFIYRLKDGKSELAVEVPAKRLFCEKGKLYFMLNSYELYTFNNMKDGYIYCYDPVSGDISLISGEQATTMFVYDDGIYYKTIKDTIHYDDGNIGLVEGLYFYSFTSNKVEEIKVTLKDPYKWNDYFVTYEPVKTEGNADETYYSSANLKLETLDKSKSIKLADNWKYPSYSIYENKFYYIQDDKHLRIFDLEAQKSNEVPLATTFSNDFTVLNGMIYMSSLLQINTETGMQSIISPEKNEVLYELYTDGENLYGVCGSVAGMKSGVLKQIVLEEFPEKAVVTEKDGVNYEINRFIFHAQPIGEE